MSKEKAVVRIGIDVGGTFTHAVAIDSSSMSLIEGVKVPTTHRAQEGVAKGIIESLQLLLDKAEIEPGQVGFIAHSTTQATNALLEGDVASVGILCLGEGFNGAISKQVSNLKNIELAKDKHLNTFHRYLDVSSGVNEKAVLDALDELVDEGAKAIAVSQAFSVDDSEAEKIVVELARKEGLCATAGHEVSQLYGFKIRTRTAVINAAMLPKMIESADMTESSVRDSGINAPVMIMRSDGGVMDIDAMRKRPILTMLSGPAAGVAAAMMFLHISDGIFLEVGGTSTDISAISNGRAKIRTAEVGGHRIYMKTLDVRTEGVAGGSLPRIKNNQIVDVGPRSAHIANLAYSSFEEKLSNLKVELVSPLKDDPKDYLSLKSDSGDKGYCITPTCSSNLLGLVNEDDCAFGVKESIESSFETVAKELGHSKEEVATTVLDLAADKCIPIVEALIKDHELDAELVTLVGGGGGAAAIVPFVAKKMGMRHTLAKNADLISAIGVAMALIRETVERQVINPSNDDILKIRQEAHSSVEAMGADPSTIEVQVEVDSRSNVIRATAFGATSMEDENKSQDSLSQEDRLNLVSESLRVNKDKIELAFEGKFFQLYKAQKVEKQLLGLMSRTISSLRIMDQNGSIRLQFKNAVYESTKPLDSLGKLEELLEEHADWGDAGKVIPNTMILAGPKILDFSGLPDSQAVLSLVRAELETMPTDSDVVLILSLG